MKRIVVLDTNCLIQALPSLSPYHKIWNDFVEGKYLRPLLQKISLILLYIVLTPGIEKHISNSA